MNCVKRKELIYLIDKKNKKKISDSMKSPREKYETRNSKPIVQHHVNWYIWNSYACVKEIFSCCEIFFGHFLKIKLISLISKIYVGVLLKDCNI